MGELEVLKCAQSWLEKTAKITSDQIENALNFDESKGYNYRVVPVLGGKAKSAFVKIIRLRTMDASKMSEE